MNTNLLSHRSRSSAPVTSAPAPKKRTRSAVFKVVAGLVAIFLLIAGIKVWQIMTLVSAGKKMVMPPTTVTSSPVQKGDWQPTLTAVGSINPVQGAMISAELPGTVSEINFQSGTLVKKGDILLKLDASAEQAQLRAAEAEAELAKTDLERARDLAARKVISSAEMDATAAKYEQKKAVAENIQSIIAKKEIRAPFDGAAGIRTVNPGEMVPVGRALVTLQALDRVFFDFALPQQQLSEVKPDLSVKVRTDVFPDREFDGKLTAINSAVDPVTRNVALQATLDNPDHTLRPGMFGRVKVLLPTTKPTLFIPATAISYAPYGNSVFIIEKKHDDKTGKDSLILRQQFIRTGETRGDFVSVTEGLNEGDSVVGIGVFKLRNGMDVVVDNTLQPKAEMNPKPTDA